MSLPPILFRDVLQSLAAERPEYKCYRFLDRGGDVVSLHSAESLDDRAKAIALELIRLTSPGDRVLLAFGAGLEFIESFFACQFAGVVAVPIFPPNSPAFRRRLEGILTQVEARVVLTRASDSESMKELGEFGMKILDVNEIQRSGQQWSSDLRPPSENVFLQFTSGSTGSPKGVVVTQRNLMANEEMIREDFGHDNGSTFVSWLPHGHDMGLIGGILQPLFVGAECILMSPETFLRHPIRWLEAISRYKAKTSGAPNFAYELCVARKPGPERMKSLDLSSWKVAFCGAEPVRPTTLENFATTFAEAGFDREALMPCYGMAETTLLAANRRLSRPICFDERLTPETGKHRRVTSCGNVASHSEIVIADLETLDEVSPGHEGEIWVRGDHVAAGYWNRESESKRTFGARLTDGRGPFLRTGDLGYIKNDELYVCGRTKDVLIAFGENLHAVDLEEVVGRAHPQLGRSGVAAFSVDDGERERLTVLVETPRLEEAQLTAISAAIVRHVGHELAVRIHDLVLVPPRKIPRTTSGKIERPEARRRYLEGGLRAHGARAPSVPTSSDSRQQGTI